MTEKMAQPLTNPPPSKAELASRLRVLAAHMLEVAVEMDYYGGFSEVAVHSRELQGAAGIALSWADAITADQDIPERP